MRNTVCKNTTLLNLSVDDDVPIMCEETHGHKNIVERKGTSLRFKQSCFLFFLIYLFFIF